MIDHFDWLDIAFFGFMLPIWGISVWLIWRGKPYRQYERKPVEPAHFCKRCGSDLTSEYCWCSATDKQ